MQLGGRGTSATRRPVLVVLLVLVPVLASGCGGGAAPAADPVPLGPTSSTSVAAPTSVSPPASSGASGAVSASASSRPHTASRTATPPKPGTSTARPSGRTGQRPAPARDVVWIRTPVLTHDKDFHDFTPYLNPAVPRNWVSPVDYRDGDITIRVEIVGAHDPASVPIYYLVGWGAGAGSGYIRNGVMFSKASGVLEARMRVAQLQRVVEGRDAGDVGTGWDWRHAFGQVNGDTWAANRGAALYPLTVRVTVTLHPKR